MANNTRLTRKLPQGEIPSPRINLLETGYADKVEQFTVLLESLP